MWEAICRLGSRSPAFAALAAACTIWMFVIAETDIDISKEKPAVSSSLPMYNSLFDLPRNGSGMMEPTPLSGFNLDQSVSSCVAPPSCLGEHSRKSCDNETRILISLPVFEETWFLQQLILNYLAFTNKHTVIVIHLNRDSVYAKEEICCLENMSSRVWINPLRIPVKRFTGSLFQSHWSNLDYGNERAAREDRPTFSHFMIGSSNSFFVKSGMEKHVARYGGSLQLTGKGICKKPYTHCIGVGNPQSKWGKRSSSWKPFETVVLRHSNGSLSNKMFHIRPEGSFYPMLIMRNLSRDLHNVEGAFDSVGRVYIRSILEEHVFSSYAFLRQGEVTAKLHGNTLFRTVTTSHGGSGVNHTIGPRRIKRHVLSLPEIFGFKAVSRLKEVDTLGTREYLFKLALREIASHCNQTGQTYYT
mmetsp:Transcript_3886/g.5544  ORF Transcript_3886/g.5544 Transcript_3886/m.5544 type:complete len:416 (-) Transcript_3886:186-1433(-)